MMRILYVPTGPGATQTQVWEHSPEGQRLIAQVIGASRPLAGRREEARLFAAAYDLLDALHVALPVLQQAGATVAIDVAQKAIARAMPVPSEEV